MERLRRSGEQLKPLTFSQDVEILNRNRAVFDGKLTSRILIACIVPISLVIVAVNTYTKNGDHDLRARSVMICLIMLELLSVVALSCLATKYNLISQRVTERISLSHKPRIIFMWLFGILLLFYAGLSFVTNIDDILKANTNSNPSTNSAFNLIELLAFCCQLYFVTRFSNHRFRSCLLVNLGMSFMLSSHFMCWFQNIVISTNEVFNYAELMNINHTYPNCTLLSFRESIKPFTYPTKTEYNLLVAGFLLHMWNTSEFVKENSRRLSISIMGDEEAELQGSLPEDSICDSASYSDGNLKTTSLTDVKVPAKTNECTPLLLSSWPAYSSSNRNLQRTRSLNNEFVNAPCTNLRDGNSESDAFTILRNSQKPKPRRNWTYIVIVGGLLIMLPFIVSLLVLITEEKESEKFKFVYQIFCAIYNVINLLLIVTALYKIYCRCHEKPYTRRFREQQYILAISTGGAIMFSTFCLVAGIMIETKSKFEMHTVCTLIFSNTVNIFVIFLQTILIIHSGNVVPVESSASLENIFVLLGILNFVVWFTDSFFTIPLDEAGASTSIQKEFYLHFWDVIKETIFPFSIFYRFHCCIEMYERFRHFGEQK